MQSPRSLNCCCRARVRLRISSANLLGCQAVGPSLLLAARPVVGTLLATSRSEGSLHGTLAEPSKHERMLSSCAEPSVKVKGSLLSSPRAHPMRPRNHCALMHSTSHCALSINALSYAPRYPYHCSLAYTAPFPSLDPLHTHGARSITALYHNVTHCALSITPRDPCGRHDASCAIPCVHSAACIWLMKVWEWLPTTPRQ